MYCCMFGLLEINNPFLMGTRAIVVDSFGVVSTKDSSKG